MDCFNFRPSNKSSSALSYVGNGVWKAESQAIKFKQESWGRDERYKFRMTVSSDGADDYVWWGSENADNSRPKASDKAMD